MGVPCPRYSHTGRTKRYRISGRLWAGVFVALQVALQAIIGIEDRPHWDVDNCAVLNIPFLLDIWRLVAFMTCYWRPEDYATKEQSQAMLSTYRVKESCDKKNRTDGFKSLQTIASYMFAQVIARVCCAPLTLLCPITMCDYQELRDYATMERAHQLLEQSARDGGCEDLGNTITHLHYHPVRACVRADLS